MFALLLFSVAFHISFQEEEPNIRLYDSRQIATEGIEGTDWITLSQDANSLKAFGFDERTSRVEAVTGNWILYDSVYHGPGKAFAVREGTSSNIPLNFDNQVSSVKQDTGPILMIYADRDGYRSGNGEFSIIYKSPRESDENQMALNKRNHTVLNNEWIDKASLAQSIRGKWRLHYDGDMIEIQDGEKGKLPRNVGLPLSEVAVEYIYEEKEEEEEGKVNIGHVGEKGDAGERGIPGEQGLQGIKGDPGEPGNKGKSGDMGEIGGIGREGVLGYKGPQGEKGNSALECGRKQCLPRLWQLPDRSCNTRAVSVGCSEDEIVTGLRPAVEPGEMFQLQCCTLA